MKTIGAFLFVLLSLNLGAQNNASNLIFHPVQHASLVIEYENGFIFVDPAENISDFKSFPGPTIILITHSHPDHFNPETINAIKNKETVLLGNKASIDQMGNGIFLLNGEKKTINSITIEAIPMYNTTEDRSIYHQKGEGNGYLLTIGNERVYISGDTEDIREMRELKNIDHAFVCMNLPFTMTPAQAASAVVAFKPKKVYPYHFNQKDFPGNIDTFKKLVAEGCSSEVIVLNWKETHD